MNKREEIERAIKHISDNVCFLTRNNGSEESVAAHKIALTALKVLLAEQKRIIGCDVCRGVKILHGTFCGTIPVDSDTQMEVDSDGDVDFDFCPVCGRKLSDAAHGVTNLESMLEEIANTRIKSAFYKYPKRMVFVGDFAGEAETRKEAIEREVEWLKEEKKDD